MFCIDNAHGAERRTPRNTVQNSLRRNLANYPAINQSASTEYIPKHLPLIHIVMCTLRHNILRLCLSMEMNDDVLCVFSALGHARARALRTMCPIECVGFSTHERYYFEWYMDPLVEDVVGEERAGSRNSGTHTSQNNTVHCVRKTTIYSMYTQNTHDTQQRNVHCRQAWCAKCPAAPSPRQHLITRHKQCEQCERNSVMMKINAS